MVARGPGVPSGRPSRARLADERRWPCACGLLSSSTCRTSLEPGSRITFGRLFSDNQDETVGGGRDLMSRGSDAGLDLSFGGGPSVIVERGPASSVSSRTRRSADGGPARERWLGEAVHEAPEERSCGGDGGGEGGVRQGDGVQAGGGRSTAVGEAEAAGQQATGPVGRAVRARGAAAARAEPGFASSGGLRGVAEAASRAAGEHVADGRAACAGVEGAARSGAGGGVRAEAPSGSSGLLGLHRHGEAGGDGGGRAAAASAVSVPAAVLGLRVRSAASGGRWQTR